MRIEDRPVDLAHEVVQTARCVHLQDYHARAVLGYFDDAYDQLLGRGSDCPVDFDEVGGAVVYSDFRRRGRLHTGKTQQR